MPELQIDAGLWERFFFKRTATATDYTLVDDDAYVGVTSTASARTITLASVLVEEGRIVIINDESGAAGTNNITIDTEASENIDGSSTLVISTNNGSAQLISDGTDWFTF